jgi:DNA-binding MarR family transcriptional regulator
MPRLNAADPDPSSEDPTSPASMLDLYEHPGHLLRRAQQISVSIFYDEMGNELTPVQYAILSRLAEHPGIDQVTLAGLAAIDTSTGATVCARLEEKGLLERKVIPHNRRQRALNITADGVRVLDALVHSAYRLRQRLLAPLSEVEQAQFMALLAKLVNENNEQSRAPLARTGTPGTA